MQNKMCLVLFHILSFLHIFSFPSNPEVAKVTSAHLFRDNFSSFVLLMVKNKASSAILSLCLGGGGGFCFSYFPFLLKITKSEYVEKTYKKVILRA